MSGLSASKSPPPAPRPPGRDGVAGMGYRLAAGGLAGRLRAGDGGTGPCIEDAWVRQTARFWTDITQIAARAVPMAPLTRRFAAARDGALTRVRTLPLIEICQATAALGLIAIGSSTLIYWENAHPHHEAAGRPQIATVAALAATRATPTRPTRGASLWREANLPPPVAAVAPIVEKPAPDPIPTLQAPPMVLAESTPAAVAPPPPIIMADAPAPPPRAAYVPHAVRPSFSASHLSAPRLAPAPRIFSVLATRPMPRPHHPPHAVAAQFDMPHWLTEPRAPLIMSEPPHALTLPPLARPHVDRFAAGTYVPPMMPGYYQ